MEYLKFSSLGQWTLCKAAMLTEPKDDYTTHDKKYKVYGGAARHGQLHEDHGDKGALHNFGGGKHPKAGRINWEKVGKPLHPVHSVYTERNPGAGD
jgi:hypothetical protein